MILQSREKRQSCLFLAKVNLMVLEFFFVTTVDATHDEFIVKALEQGVDVITEKPLTTDKNKCNRILRAQKSAVNQVIVGLNYRYGWQNPKIKQLLMEEKIGILRSVDFHWYLNTYHGASYFRRWHGLRANSGTLLVHKSTHHFDLLNWWINADPVEVFASGALEFYVILRRRILCIRLPVNAKALCLFSLALQRCGVLKPVNRLKFLTSRI